MQPIMINTIVMLGEEGLDQATFVKRLAQAGPVIGGVEIRQELLPQDEFARKAFFLELLETGTQKNWQLFYSVPQSLFTTTGLNPLLENWLAEAAAFGAVSVKVNIGEVAGIKAVHPQELTNLLSNYQLQLTIENDQTEANGRLQPVTEALAEVTAASLPVGYTFDVGNWLVMGEDLQQAFIKLQQQTTVLHLKNVASNRQTTLLDDGSVAWRDYLLAKVPVILEYPMAFTEIAGEVAKTRNALSENK